MNRHFDAVALTGNDKTALHKLSEKQIVELNEEKRATVVSKLLVVLCIDEAAHPAVNMGTRIIHK